MTTELPQTTTRGGHGGTSMLTLEAFDVTGNTMAEARHIQPDTPAGDVAQAISAQMQLPQGLPYTLRSDSTGQFLQDDRPIGEQVDTGARVVVTPKAHLG